MAESAIEWTDVTWNPVTGCSKVSPGCAHCYAETVHKQRLDDRHGYPPFSPWTPANAELNVICRHDRLEDPLRWRKPRMVFVNSMSDLFHEQVPDGFIGRVMTTIRRSPRHTFQVLTKRPERMRDLLSNWWSNDPADWGEDGHDAPPRNLWLGVSIENRRFVDRADLLRETPAAVRFISAEPLLGPLVPAVGCEGDPADQGQTCWFYWPDHSEQPCNREDGLDLTDIDWLIVGGESGPKARRMGPQWVRDLRDACIAQGGPAPADVHLTPDRPRPAFFFKQWGGRTPKANGRELDGRTWNEMPGVGARG